MKKLVHLFLLFPFFCLAQKDSSTPQRKAIGWELVLPFEPGLSYYLSSSTNEASAEASHLLSHPKAVGTRLQALSAQLHFYDRAYIGLAYTLDGVGFKNADALEDLQKHQPGYFVQEESKYISSSGFSYGKYTQHYFRAEIGLNIRLKKFMYLQPFVSYGIGRGTVPSGKYGFKDNSSNYFYENSYSFRRPMVNVINAGFNFNLHSQDNNEEKRYMGYWGFRLDYTRAVATATGIVSSTDIYSATANREYSMKRTSSYISLSVFVGVSSYTDKR
ncbi:MAG: hypothetical protein JWO44_2234 [Bacteroidetes bacterium]|nr:hypothetical protein [Bacteroidota bacterium]